MATNGPLWYDTKANKIVSKEPEEGFIIFTEADDDLSDEARAIRLAQYESLQAVAADEDASRAAAQESATVETADAPAPTRTATTATASPKKRR